MAKKSRVEKQSWKETDADIGGYKVLREDCGRRRVRRRRAWSLQASAIHHIQVCAAGREVGSLRLDAQRAHVLAHERKQHNHTFEHAWNLFTTEGHSSATSTSTEKPACTSTVTDKPAGAETPAQSAGRGTKRTTKKEHDEDDRAKGKMVTAKATPRPSPKKSRALPQHQAAGLVRTRYHEAVPYSTTLISVVEKDHMLGDLKKRVKTMSDLVHINTRLFLIGMPSDAATCGTGVESLLEFVEIRWWKFDC